MPKKDKKEPRLDGEKRDDNMICRHTMRETKIFTDDKKYIVRECTKCFSFFD